MSFFAFLVEFNQMIRLGSYPNRSPPGNTVLFSNCAQLENTTVKAATPFIRRG